MASDLCRKCCRWWRGEPSQPQDPLAIRRWEESELANWPRKRMSEPLVQGTALVQPGISSCAGSFTGALRLDVRLFSGDQLAAICVEPSSTVIDLKISLLSTLAPGTRVQSLMHGSNELHDSQTFENLEPYRNPNAPVVLLAIVSHFVTVLLVDGTTRELTVSPGATFADLGDQMAEQLRVPGRGKFCFFQGLEGISVTRMIPDAESVEVLLEQWNEATSRKVTLFWKRWLLAHDEVLDRDNDLHAKLVFKQATMAYLECPVCEDDIIPVQIAARILAAESGRFKEFIDGRKLHHQGVLEQILPAIYIAQKTRRGWSDEILKAAAEIGALDQETNTFQNQQAAFSMLQRTKFIGGHLWFGKQIYNVPNDGFQTSAPTDMCKINPRSADSEWVICVDQYGIRFVQSGHPMFQRGFLFNSEAMEHVIRCDTCPGILRIVVTTINIVRPAAGRVEMTIAISCPAAVDVGNTIARIQSWREDSGA